MPCTYDFEVAGAKYLHALDAGEIPLLFLFSGTVFTRGEARVHAPSPSPGISRRATACPSQAWRELMDRYFPGGGWLRLSRSSIDAPAAVQGRAGAADLGPGDRGRCSRRRGGG